MVVLGGAVVSYERGTPVLVAYIQYPCDGHAINQVSAQGFGMAAKEGGWRDVQGYLAHKNTPTPLGAP